MKSRKIVPRFSIRARFVISAVLLALVAGGAIGLILVDTTRTSLRREVLDDNQNLADLTAQFTANYLTTLERNISGLAANAVVRQAVLNGTPEQALTVLSQFGGFQTGLTGAAIYDEKGIMRAFSTPNATSIGQSFMDRDYVRQAITTGLPYLGQAIISRATGQPTAGYAVPILDDMGRVRGAVSGGISLASLSDALVKVSSHHESNTVILDTRNATIVANADPQLLLTQLPAGNKVVQQLSAGEHGIFEITGNNRTDLVGFTPAPGLPWGVIVTTPSAPAMAIVDSLNRQYIIFTAIIAALAALAGMIAVTGITRPLRRFVEETRKIGQGDLDYKEPDAGQDEIGDLSREFSQMAKNLAVSRDSLLGEIAERRQVEEKLQKSERFFKSVFNSTNDAISIINVRDFTIAAVNKAFLQQYNTKEEEVIGKTCHQVTHHKSVPCTPPDNRCPLLEANNTGTFSVTEHVHYAGDNSPTFVEVMASPIKDADGRIVQIVHVTRDITERNKLQEQLISQDRLASIGQLVSGVAHELNNPLTSVIGFSELLLQKNLPPDVKADLNIIADEAQRSAVIVKNLLTFARKQTEGKSPVDINEIIKRVLALREHEQKVHNIRVETNFTPQLPKISGNSSQLQQVLFNIIINAEQAMLEAHGKGTITISTESTDGIVKVSIRDDGPGISPENMRKLFTPFFTTKGVGKGTGLGLSISHGIVTGHGGQFHVRSEIGKGATFIMELPCPPPEKLQTA